MLSLHQKQKKDFVNFLELRKSSDEVKPDTFPNIIYYVVFGKGNLQMGNLIGFTGKRIGIFGGSFTLLRSRVLVVLLLLLVLHRFPTKVTQASRHKTGGTPCRHCQGNSSRIEEGRAPPPNEAVKPANSPHGDAKGLPTDR